MEEPKLHISPKKYIGESTVVSVRMPKDMVADLDRITTEIEQTIQNTLEREVSTDKIGEMVMARLKPLDEVAYIRFASVYRRFQDVNSFIHEINQFLGENKE